jgi:IS5 family transposase
MSLKNTKQYSLADNLVVQHKSLSKLDGVHNIINWIEIEKTCQISIHLFEAHQATHHW